MSLSPDRLHSSWMGYVVGPAFLGLAAWFWWGPPLLDLPITPAAQVDRSLISTEPRRQALGEPPRIHIAGFERTCMECHRRFPTGEKDSEKLLQHEGIVFDHGPHDSCTRCHHEDRNRLALQDGTPVPFTEVTRLCRECHGLVYRDWEHGAHGRTNGYWDTSRGERRRLLCTECHDPHNPKTPAMSALVPLPPPRTLRMGGPAPVHESKPSRDPLERAVHGKTKDH